MRNHLLQPGRKYAADFWRALPRLWQEPAPQLRPVSHCIQLSLQSSRLARRVKWLFISLNLLYVIELALLGHWLMAAAAIVLAALHGWVGRTGHAAASSRRLLIGSDGRLHLLRVSGELEPVSLHPSSLRLGPWLLLVLRERAGVHRLLLGPDNLEAGQLAALRRRVAAITQRLGGTR